MLMSVCTRQCTQTYRRTWQEFNLAVLDLLLYDQAEKILAVDVLTVTTLRQVKPGAPQILIWRQKRTAKQARSNRLK